MNLKQIMLKHGTDKVTQHNYADNYEFHFEFLRELPLKLFEIGVGGYDRFNDGGCSLRAWKEYFPNSTIFSIDIEDKTHFQEDRIVIQKGSQIDQSFLKRFNDEFGTFDIIIDDGSHINSHIITSFEILFPLLKTGGIYVIEDTQTSYLPEYRGGSPISTIDYFKKFADALNYREKLDYTDHTYYDKNIVSIHFYHNMIFIYKGENIEESNLLKNNKRRF